MLWYKKKQKHRVFVPKDIDRIREFLLFCIKIEEHPFVVNHKSGGKLQHNLSVDKEGHAKSTVNFDEIHLESLLTKLRQFFFRGELFFIKDLRRSVIKVFGETKKFKKFYDGLWAVIKKPLPMSNIEYDGADVIAGYTFTDLIELKLYSGAIHSMQRLDPEAPEPFKRLSDANKFIEQHLSWVIAGASLDACMNIYSFRRHILCLARDKGKVEILPELSQLDIRLKDVSC